MGRWGGGAECLPAEQHPVPRGWAVLVLEAAGAPVALAAMSST